MDKLTPQELADRWGITRTWLYNLKREGKVPKYYSRGGKGARITFPIEEVEKFEAEQCNLKG